MFSNWHHPDSRDLKMGSVDPIDLQEASIRETETKVKDGREQDATTIKSDLNKEQNFGIESLIESHFSDLNVVDFPSLVGTENPGQTAISSVCSISLENFLPSTHLAETLQLSWASILSHYTQSNDVLFGTRVLGHAETSSQALWTSDLQDECPSIPLRLQIDPQKSVKQSNEDIRKFSHDLSALDWRAMRWEAHSQLAKSIFSYQTELIITLDPSVSKFRHFYVPGEASLSSLAPSQLLLTLSCKQGLDNNVLCQSQYSTGCFDKEHVERLLQQFASVVSQVLSSNDDLTIAEIEYASPQDLLTLSEWNSGINQAVMECIHDLVSFQALKTPEKNAVCAWDGDLSYSALEALSSQLARYLVRKGLNKGSIVPLVFEKSKWTIVAMLAVLKAGGVCVAIDVRNRDAVAPRVLEQTRPQFILTSESQSSALPTTAATVLKVCDRSAVDWMIEGSSVELPRVEPQDRAFIIFTSGSTDKPKGIVFDHTALVTSMRAHGQSLNMNQDSRVLQFSSYAFDVSIFEIFTTLTLGATVCVPSESQRMNSISSFIVENIVTWAWFTPSFLRTLRPCDVPGLATIAVGGEAPTNDIVEEWSENVELINGYGPAEATICASGRLSKKTWIAGTFGRAVGCTAWITDPSDPNKLSAIGAVGELLIEGPVLAQGYLDEPEKKAATFIVSPRWTTHFQTAGPSRTFYRTGDLVQYNAHGTLRYIGRNDSQVKINGQRIELGMVENQSNSFGGGYDVIVVAATPKDGHELILAAFLAGKKSNLTGAGLRNNATEIIPVTEKVSAHVQRIREHLSKNLPAYMVPTMFVPISGLPLTATGKTDRLYLRNMISKHSRAKLAGTTHKIVADNVPLTESQLAVRLLIATAFSIDPTTINMQHSFMQLGGDSLVAIKLISIARQKELVLTAEKLLSASSLSELAKHLKYDTSIASQPFPFEYFEDTKDLANVVTTAIDQCNVSKDQIEDIYPTTDFQANFILKNIFNPGMYAGRFLYELPSDIDLKRFHQAWTATINATPILRSRLIRTSQGDVFQVVLDHLPEWTTYPTLDSLPRQELGKEYGYGKPLLYLSLASTRDLNDRAAVYFVLEMQHSLYDGFSFSLILEQVQAAYEGQDLAESKFFPFVRYLQEQDMTAAEQFWNQRLLGTKAIPFPKLPSAEYVPVAATPGKRVTLEMTLSHDGRHTATSMARLAWALIISSQTRTNDVVFGTLAAGRNVPLEGIAEINGPTMAIVPIRWVLNPHNTIREELERIQEQSNAMIPFEQIGLKTISQMGPDHALACEFQSCLVVQPESVWTPPDLFKERIFTGPPDGFSEYAWAMVFSLHETSVDLFAHFDNKVIGEEQVENIMQQLGKVLHQINENKNQRISELGILTHV